VNYGDLDLKRLVQLAESGDAEARRELARRGSDSRMRSTGKLRVRVGASREPGGGDHRDLEMVIATEAPVRIWDWETWSEMPEVLLMTGARMPAEDYLPFQDSHSRMTVADTLGHVDGLNVNDDELLGVPHFAETDRAKNAFELVDGGHLRKASVGYQVHKYQRIGEGESAEVDGRLFDGPALVAVDWEPLEVSLVAVPADPRSGFRTKGQVLGSPELDDRGKLAVLNTLFVEKGRSAHKGGTEKMKVKVRKSDGTECELSWSEIDALRRGGQSVTVIETGEVLKALNGAGKRANDDDEDEDKDERAEDMMDDEDEDEDEKSKKKSRRTPKKRKAANVVDVEAEREAAALRERTRIEGVRLALAACGSEIQERAVSEVWTIQRAKDVAQAASATQPLGQRVQVTRDQRDTFRKGAVDAILIRGGIAVKDPSPEWMKYRGYTLRDFVRESLEVAGNYHRGADMEEMIETALSRANRPRLRFAGRQLLTRADAAFSHTTSDLPLLLADVQNKALQTGYEEAPTTYQVWTRKVSIGDFKDRHVIRLSESPDLLQVSENGEFTEGKLSDEEEKYRLITFGRILSVTRQTIRNDDLDGLTRIPRMMGAAARRLPNRLVYRILKANPDLSDTVALFHSTHANLGTAGDITVATISELRALMQKQAGMQPANDDGEKVMLNITPRYLITTPTMATTAEQVIGSAGDPAKTNANVINPFFNKLQVVSDAELEQGTSAWQYEWAVAADTSQIDTIEVAFLDGVDAPFFEEQEGFEIDGLRMKVRLDVAAAPIDYRGLAKNAYTGPGE